MIVLVVEDGDDARESLRILLEMLGHTVRTASNGVEAIYTAAVQLPDVVLMDLGMPLMNGFVAAEAMRRNPSMRDCLLVAVSAYLGSQEWRDRALAAGFDECLSKPLDFEALERLLQRRST